MEQRHAIVTVINDLYSDRRVDRTCRELLKLGFRVTLIGRMLRDSPPMDERPYHTHRLSMIFRSGVMMYVEMQIRLFFWLLTHKGHFFWSNDLDTVFPCWFVGRIRNMPVIQDSHEYFTGVPELAKNHGKRKLWKALERFTYPRVNELITVNESIAKLFREEYKREVHVIRNVPEKIKLQTKKTRQELGLPEDKPVLLLQGAGINVERGAEELVMAMQQVEKAVLFIIGSGDVIPELKQMVSNEKMQEKVIFKDRLPLQELVQFTLHADLGFSLDKPLSINYTYSLPNKLFDYIHTSTPVIVSNIPEVRKIVEKYNIGLVLQNHQPEHIAQSIRSALDNKERYSEWKENFKFAISDLNWEQEKIILHEILRKYV